MRSCLQMCGCVNLRTALVIGRAEMIGTTRSRVSYFMNRFRKLGFMDYDGRIRVHESLLDVILLDQLSEHNL
jgi:hypothetical protein